MPNTPMEFVDLDKIDHGVMFKGSKGFLISSFDHRALIPYGYEADMSYYQRRPKDEILEPMGDFQQEWISACKGDLRTSCDFEYAGNMMEQLVLGLVAYRTGGTLEYDSESGQVKNNSKANELLSRPYRPGWILNG